MANKSRVTLFILLITTYSNVDFILIFSCFRSLSELLLPFLIINVTSYFYDLFFYLQKIEIMAICYKKYANHKRRRICP